MLARQNMEQVSIPHSWDGSRQGLAAGFTESVRQEVIAMREGLYFALRPVLAALLLLASTFAETVHAQAYSTAQGSSTTAPEKTLECPQDRRMVGLNIRYGDLIDDIRPICVAPRDSGAWSGMPTATGSTPTNNPMPGNSYANLTCPQDQYLTAFRSYLRATLASNNTAVVARLELRCSAVDFKLAPKGGAGPSSPAQGGGQTTGGAWVPAWSECPTTHPVADGIRVRAGFFIDQLQLRCASGNPTPTVIPSAFALASPADEGALGESQGLSWQAASQALNYFVYLLPDPPGGTIDWNAPSVTTRSTSSPSLTLDSSLRQQLRGKRVAWTVRACHFEELDGCRWASKPQFFHVPLQNAAHVAPEAGATFVHRRPAFSWSAVPGATHYKVVLQPGIGVSPTTRRVITPRNFGTATSFTPAVDLPDELGNTPVWFVQACVNFPKGAQDVCSEPLGGPLGTNQFRSIVLGSAGHTFGWSSGGFTAAAVSDFDLHTDALFKVMQFAVTESPMSYPLGKDNQPCSGCHASDVQPFLGNATKEQFCTLVRGYARNPTKPANLKALFSDWHARGCP
jgi:hypothetical protein